MKKQNITEGFSLIEVTVALALVAFGLVAVFGLLPVGQNLSAASSRDNISGNILSSVSSDFLNIKASDTRTAVHHMPFWDGSTGQVFFDEYGNALDISASQSDARFVANATVRGRSSNSPPSALIQVTRAQQGNLAGIPVEAVIALPVEPPGGPN